MLTIKKLTKNLGGRTLLTGIDRLDYSKGLALRFDAFEDLLTRYPEHRRHVTYLQIATISRGVPAGASSPAHCIAS